MTLRIVFSILLGIAILVNTQAQGSGLQTEYLKDDKITRVKTHLLYVYNTPDQFVALQFWCWFKGQTLTKPPSEVGLRIFSISKSPIYLKEKDRRVIATADGETLRVGTPGKSVLKGGTKNGVDYFSGLTLPIPQTAHIKAGGDLNDMTLELMTLSTSLQQFLKLSKATKLEFRVGTTPLVIDEHQLEVIRNFANQITTK